MLDLLQVTIICTLSQASLFQALLITEEKTCFEATIFIIINNIRKKKTKMVRSNLNYQKFRDA